MRPVEGYIVSHHVGARGFVTALTVPSHFKNDIVHVIYEGDPDCAARMQAENKDPNCHVMPYALGAADADRTLHVTANPYGSSLYRPNPAYAAYYGEVYNSDGTVYDAVFGDWCKLVSEVPVPVKSLDGLKAAGMLPAGGFVDFLSLDTQGSEADILAGAAGVLDAGVLAVATEIEFHPIYSGQPLFDQILSRLRGHGFHFAGFTHISDEISPYRAPLGLRAHSFLAFGDALFLRQLDDLPRLAGGDPALQCELAYKAAFIALVFGYVEYALAALDMALALQKAGLHHEALNGRRYVCLLQEFDVARRRMEQVMPPMQPTPTRMPPNVPPVDYIGRSAILQAVRRVWATLKREVSVYYDSLNRHVDNLPHRRIRHLLTEKPLEALLRCFVYGLRFIDGKLHKHTDTSPYFPSVTVVEQVLQRYDLDWVASLIRNRRLRAVRHLKGLP